MSTEISKEDARKALDELEASHAAQVAKLRAVIDAPEQNGLWRPTRENLGYIVYGSGAVAAAKDVSLLLRASYIAHPSKGIAEKAAVLQARCNKWIAAGLQADPNAGEWGADREWFVWSYNGALRVESGSSARSEPVYVHTEAQAEEMRRILIAEGLEK